MEPFFLAEISDLLPLNRVFMGKRFNIALFLCGFTIKAAGGR